MLRGTALLLLAALVVGGCASGRVRAANDYVKAVNRAQSSFAATQQDLLIRLRPGAGPAVARAGLKRLYAAVDGFVARLESIRPPAPVRALHARLIAQVRGFERSLRAAGSALTSGNGVRVLDGQQQLATVTSGASRDLDRTLAAINAALHK